MTTRPAIPEATKREVRQRCGFGCVVCGSPLYHYDHIEEYSRLGVHEASNITLLCGSHHDQKSRKQLPTERVRRANEKPHNANVRHTTGHPLYYNGDRAHIVAGGNHILVEDSASAVTIDGHSLIGFELVDGVLLLNVDLRGGDGSPVLLVVRNELVHATDLWDVTYEGNRLTLRRGPGDLLISIAFETSDHRVVVDQGLVAHNGVEILFDHNALCVLNNRIVLSANSVSGMSSAISIGEGRDWAGPVGFQMSIPRGPFDRAAAVQWARARLRDRR